MHRVLQAHLTMSIGKGARTGAPVATRTVGYASNSTPRSPSTAALKKPLPSAAALSSCVQCVSGPFACIGHSSVCVHRRCKGCDVCKGHHPERACTAAVTGDDTSYETCQPWCSTPEHCSSFCKCKGCVWCHTASTALDDSALATSTCTPKDASDLDMESCESWCTEANAHSNCAYCKCRSCAFCPRCRPWCERPSDCAATACSACELCTGIAPAMALPCEGWCKEHRTCSRGRTHNRIAHVGKY